jgi:SAM-dependent methyltransferase
MSSPDIERRVAEYYTGKLREHGPTHRGVDWNSRESQLLRFEQFMRAFPVGEPVSVLDYGCGYGTLGEYLEQAGVDFEYVGYDVSEEMVSTARGIFGDRPRWAFTTARDELRRADVTVASGIFNVRVGTEAERWQEYTLRTISELASLSSRALAFNMLTSYSDPERMTDRLFYGDPAFYFDWCKRNLSRDVALLHDYGLYEFTIVVRLA